MLCQAVTINSIIEHREPSPILPGIGVDFISTHFFLVDGWRLFLCLQTFFLEAIMDTALKPQQEVMSRAEAASYLRICRTTLDRLTIPKTKIRKRVLYRKAVLDQWLAQQTEGAKA
jgi:hypothetical protein